MIELDAESLYRGFAQRVRDRVAGRDVRLVGIYTGGVWLAERLAADLGVSAPVGVLDASFYRDDFAQGGLKPTVRPSRIAFEMNDADVLLVDDVLYTGRTTRAALNELFDHGRPRRVDLAVLVDRGGRQLPFAATVVGTTLEVPPEVTVVLSRDTDGKLHLKLESDRR